MAAVVMGLAAGPAVAADQVYWGNEGGKNISHANVAGGGGDDIPITGVSVDHPQGLAIDSAAGKIYWVNRDVADYSIRYANLDGSAGSILDTTGAPVDDPLGLAIDPALGRLYWVNFGGNSVYYANLDGSGGGELDTSGAVVETPVGLAVYPAQNRIYWANFEDSSNPVAFANLDGTGGGGSLDLTGAEVDMPEGIAIDPLSNRVYWANRESIGFASANGGDGGKVDTDGLPTEPPEGLAIDPFRNTIYWGERESDIIGFAGLDGVGPFGFVETTGATADDPGYPVLLQDPRNTGAPTISASPVPGDAVRVRRPLGTPAIARHRRMLSCTQGSWAPDLLESFLYRAPHTISFQWLRNGNPISDATTSSYLATEVGTYLCRVAAANAAGSTSSESAPVGISAAFKLGEPRFNHRKGTASLLVGVSGAGTLALSGKGVKLRKVTVKERGNALISTLVVKPKGRAKERLQSERKSKLNVRVTYTPAGGSPLRRSKRITLRLAGR
ncbi:MAG TPA: hypothetical protein VGF09_02915 [Solirubrobacterales bacterium]